MKPFLEIAGKSHMRTAIPMEVAVERLWMSEASAFL
jgi:hypothetical protein